MTDETKAVDLTPMTMLQTALTSGAGVDTLERLLALQERWQEQQARRAFEAALSGLRAELPPILKTREVDFTSSKGRTHYRHEDLAEISGALSPVMAKHGLSFRWRTDTGRPGEVQVTCIVAHRDGHSEETALSGPYDQSGNKNPIQAIGSAVTYLQRYTLKAALGVAAAHDDDGRASRAAVEAQRDAAREKALEPFKNLWAECSDVLTSDDWAEMLEEITGKRKVGRDEVLAAWRTTVQERRNVEVDDLPDPEPADEGEREAQQELGNGQPDIF